jgi:hypothetical protein
MDNPTNERDKKRKNSIEAAPDEVRNPFLSASDPESPKRLGSLRKRWPPSLESQSGDLSVGAGIFEPRGKKKGILVALRKLGRRAAKKLLEEKGHEVKERKIVRRRRKRARK